jgi:hypothetical protein
VKTSNGKVFPIAYQTMSPQNIREKGEKNKRKEEKSS